MGTITLCALALTLGTPGAVSNSTFRAFESELRYFDSRRKPNENLVFSPVGIQLAGTAVMMGSRGPTRAGMMKALGIAASDEAGLAGDFRDLLFQYGSGSEVGMHSSLWLYRTEPKPAFKKSLAAFLNTEIHGVSDYRVVHTLVNDWVRESTKNRIEKILEPQTSDFAFAAVSTNTFDGQWPAPLALVGPESEQAIAFRPESGAGRKVPTLRSKAAAYPLEGGGELVSLDYKGSSNAPRFALVLAIPPAGQSAREMVRALSMDRLRAALRQKAGGDAPIVSFPKFKVESAPDLKSYLRQGGARLAFSPGAEFPDFGPQIFLGDARHKAMIEVDEEGTKAASATVITGFRGGPPKPPRRITVDRPFVFLVYDRQAEIPLFGGVVAKL